MNINKLLNSGRPECSRLEKTADILLSFHRKEWLGKSVKIVKDVEGKLQVNHDAKGSPLLRQEKGVLYKNVRATALLFAKIFLSIVLSPLLLVGLLLKKISHLKDKKAELYANAVDAVWHKKGLEASKAHAEKSKAQADKKIAQLQDMIDLIEVKPERREYLTVKNPEEVLHNQEKLSAACGKRSVKLEVAIGAATARLGQALDAYNGA